MKNELVRLMIRLIESDPNGALIIDACFRSACGEIRKRDENHAA